MDIKRKQELCLDAIRSSFLMAQIAYTRIENYCRVEVDKNQEILDNGFILDAWAFIDVAKRLRSMISQSPGIKTTGKVLDFISDTESIKDFRDYIQHLEERTKTVAPTGRPIWGAFSWMQLLDDKKFKIVVFVPGKLAPTKDLPVVNPAGRETYSDIDHIEITIQDVTLNLSELKRHIESLESQFNVALDDAAQKKLSNGEQILSIELGN